MVALELVMKAVEFFSSKFGLEEGGLRRVCDDVETEGCSDHIVIREREEEIIIKSIVEEVSPRWNVGDDGARIESVDCSSMQRS